MAERIAIESYGEIIRYIGDADATTRRLMEDKHAGRRRSAQPAMQTDGVSERSCRRYCTNPLRTA